MRFGFKTTPQNTPWPAMLELFQRPHPPIVIGGNGGSTG